MSTRDPILEFQEFNRNFARRNPELLRLKVERMANSAFGFFRGTFHLFARDLLDNYFEGASRIAGAELDLVGDVHGENFGTYRADDSHVHYDINDFDETTQGRFDLDVRRLATSCVLSAQDRGDGLAAAIEVTLAFLDAYTETLLRLLKKGKGAAFDVHETTSSGSPAVDRLVREMAAVKRGAFIQRLTEFSGGKRRVVRSARYFNLPEEERAQALRLLE